MSNTKTAWRWMTCCGIASACCTDLKSRSGFDVSLPVQNVSDDIAAIEAGLIQLRGEVPAIAPRVDWS